MKALSIMQPWAWAILCGGKPVENRTWATEYRGPLLIHASKRFDRDAYQYIIPRLDHGLRAQLRGEIPYKQLPRGGIVGVANLVACVSASRMHTIYPKRIARWFEGPFGFVLEDPRELPFLPWPGRLGLFEFPDELLPRLGLTKVTAPTDNDKRPRSGVDR